MNEPSENIRICICGDCAPIERATALFAAGDVESIFGGLLQRMRQADVCVANLEAPLYEVPSPACKEGRVIGAPASCIEGLRGVPFSALGIANNHVMDHGEAGLNTTLRVCKETGVPTFGAGKNLEEAAKPWVTRIKGRSIAFIGLAEDEFCLATKESPGAFPFDAMHFARYHLEQTVERYDHTIAFVHAGREMYPYPSPEQREMTRFLIDFGVSAVIHQHSHTPGCYEFYKGRPAIYGQGNFVFDSKRKRKNGILWHRGLLVELTIAQTGISIDLVPLEQFSSREGLEPLVGEEKDAFLSDIEERSAALETQGFVERRWTEFCEAHRDHYLSVLNGDARLMETINKSTGLLRLKYRGKSKLRAFNYIRRQTHREVLKTLLRSGDF